MTSYRHLIAIDLSSYGSALALINQFSDDQDVKVIEVSPLGAAGLLLLATKEAMACEVLKNQILSYHGASLLNIELIHEAHADLLLTYLSQKQAAVTTNLLVMETNFVSAALKMADTFLKSSIALVDLRVVRTFPCNVIVTLTSDKADLLLSKSEPFKNFKSTLIANVQPSLKSYFEVLQ